MLRMKRLPPNSFRSEASGSPNGRKGGKLRHRRGAEMKPYVICHMNASVDGRILGSRWRPAENRMAGLFERLHEPARRRSWLIGRVTGRGSAKGDSHPRPT